MSDHFTDASKTASFENTPETKRCSKDTIYRQAAIETIRKCAVKEVTPAYMLIDKAEAMTELMNLPSADPEIIYCKDCEYYHPSFCEIWSKYGTVQTRGKGYCYMAERRADE